MDYEGLAMSEAYKLWVAQSQELQRIQTNPLPYNTKIAMLINLYNILCIHGFIAIGPPQTSQQRRHFWSHTAYALAGESRRPSVHGQARTTDVATERAGATPLHLHPLAGHVFTLQDIHHGILRANRKPPNTYLRVFGVRDERARIAAVVWDPRIHFALNHGTKGSPPLRVFRASTLDRDLDDAARAFLTRNVEIQTLGPVNPLRAEGTLKVALPSLLETFSEDFGGDSTQMLRWVAQYLPQKDLILDAISRWVLATRQQEDGCLASGEQGHGHRPGGLRSDNALRAGDLCGLSSARTTQRSTSSFAQRPQEAVGRLRRGGCLEGGKRMPVWRPPTASRFRRAARGAAWTAWRRPCQ